MLAQAEAEAKKRLLMDYRMLESRIGHANEMLDFERRCSGSGVSLQLIHGKRRPSLVEAMPTPEDCSGVVFLILKLVLVY